MSIRTSSLIVTGLLLATIGASNPRAGLPTLDQPRSTTAVTDLTGRWEAIMAGDSRSFTIRFNFQVHGDTLTGTVSISNIDGSFDITRGRIKGDRVTFEAFGSWAGMIKEDGIDLTREIDNGRRQRMTAYRVK